MSGESTSSATFVALLAAVIHFSGGRVAAASESEWLLNAFSARQAQPEGKPSKAPQKENTAKGATAPNKPVSLVGDHFAPAGTGRWQWKVTKSGWTAADESAFGVFIRNIGESDCKTTHECLTSPIANPSYHTTNPPGLAFFADCADLPFALRAYFAWKNGLPFSFSSALALHPRTRRGKSETNVFQVVGRYHIVPPGPDARQVLTEVARVSTAHFRMPADYKGRMLADHYPVDITRESVTAGTVIFDALGHIAVVYKVDDDGIVHYIDGHPDNSLTRGVFGSDIDRAGPDSGAGFLRWRPQKLVGARIGKDGIPYGGMLMLARNEQLPDWSDAQYYGLDRGRSPDWRQARFFFNDEEVDYFTYIRLRLARKGFRFDPISEVRRRVGAICQELRQRVDAVDAAVRAGMPRRPQPSRLPSNIYVTFGDWETYATPSRDVQLKVQFMGLREDIKRFISMHAAASRHITYDGADLLADLKQAYDSAADACTITYTRTDGSPRTLLFGEINQRLFLMSFDPHHCVERRWGATSSDELSTCPDNKLKQDWYEAQQRLRNQTVRTIGDRMSFTIEDLHRQARESSDEVGEDEPPVIEVASLLAGR